MKTEMQKLKDGEPYLPRDPEVTAAIRRAQRLCVEYNALDLSDSEALDAKAREIFGGIGNNASFIIPMSSEFGILTTFGDNFFSNRNLTLIDQGGITVGDNCMFGPNVTIVTSNHPLDAEQRNTGLVISKRVTIGDNVWICANALILPGVTIGDNAVVAAGSVVTKDVPPNTLVAGNPAKKLRDL